MHDFVEQLKRAVTGALRPPARVARRLLTPAIPRPQLQFCRIIAGPACGCIIQLPTPTDLSDAITSGEYETASLQILMQLVNATDVCVDIGGHYGVYTLTLARLATQGHVHVFEPVPYLAKSIEVSLRESDLSNASVHNAAVAEVSGDLEFRYATFTESDDSMGHLPQHGGVPTYEARSQYETFTSTTVRTITLDELDVSPDFVKIDAEGSEGAVLKGGAATLRRRLPRLMIELHGIRESLMCEKWLREIGYYGFCIEDRGATVASVWVHSSDETGLAILRGITPPLLNLSPGNFPSG